MPAVALAGRSNVGKSSLLNRLVGQRKLARVSKRPGGTRQVNFFVVDERLVLVDLPGYGFARVPAGVQAAWKALVEGYLSGDSDLRLVIVLVDIRRGLLEADARLLEYLASIGRQALVVATKIDQLDRDQRRRSLAAMAASAGGRVLACSARTGEGVAQLWAEVEKACAKGTRRLPTASWPAAGARDRSNR